MEQNRFSRQLIVLRAVINGYSGHARMLHTDGNATLEIRVQSPGCANLWAALVEKTDDSYAAQSLGALSCDERGQASGTFSLAGCRIAPEILAIVQADEADCKLAMSGFLTGARSVNWADVRAAACEAVSSGGMPDAGNELPDPPADDPFADFGANTEHPFSGNVTAAQAAGISPDAIWPEEIAALQEAFFAQAAVQAFPGSAYTFILVPAEDDLPEYFAGLRCEGGVPVRACYAVPAEDRDDQPPELAGFCWREGFWAAYIDVETGQQVTPEY